MTDGTGASRYEIEFGGHTSERVLRPVVDEFTVELTDAGTTRLVGDIRDASHLNGLLAHFTSLNVEVIGLRRLDQPTSTPPRPARKNNLEGEQP